MNAENADKRFAPVHTSKTFNRILDTFNLRTKKVLDIGCGFGEYLVKFGPESLGITTTPDEVEYAKLRDIRMKLGNAELLETLELREKFEAIWSNNLFEHILAPHAFLITLKRFAESETLLVLGVPVIPRIVSLLRIRKFRGALAVAHINFFTRESLRLTVTRAGWNVKDIRPFLFGNPALDRLVGYFAPHLYVVAYNDSNFKYDSKKLKEWSEDVHYQAMLKVTNQASASYV